MAEEESAKQIPLTVLQLESLKKPGTILYGVLYGNILHCKIVDPFTPPQISA